MGARRVLVVGLGNPDRGDDGVGMLVAENLRRRLPADVVIVTPVQDTLALIDELAGFDALVCVDAAAPRGTPGRVVRVDLADDLPRDLALTSSHAFGLAELIALARTLQLAPPETVVYAIEGCCFDTGAALTPPVRAAVADAVDRITAEVDLLRRTSSATRTMITTTRPL